MAMLNELGAKMHMDELRTHFKHPSNPSQNVLCSVGYMSYAEACA